ncbi:hypothetical protein KUCAC02_035051, partial [Chaenocephalus aceratus]
NPTAQSELLQPPSIPQRSRFSFLQNPPSVKREVDCRNGSGASHRARNHMSEVSAVLANCGSHWTCERVFVLDHKRWTGPMKQAVDNLLNPVATSGNVLNTCASRSNFNAIMLIKLDLFHCLRRLMRESCQPNKASTREHCRIPHPEELSKRVEGVFQHFHLATDPNGRPLFKASLLKCWRIQRIHILRGCLSDPERHVPAGRLSLPPGSVGHWHTRFHRAVSSSGDDGGGPWNYQRLVDLKQPDVKLPAVFDPALMGEINAVSQTGVWHTGLAQQQGRLDQALDTPPQTSNPTAQTELLQPPSIPPTKPFQFPANPPSVKREVTAGTTPEPHTEPETTCQKSLLSSPTAARTGPYVKHLSKLLNTSTSINISPEKLQERQVLWHSHRG